MRLGQLSRQLEVKPEQIVAYLAKKEITVKQHPNAKVEDELIEELTAHFKPVVVAETVEIVEEPKPKKEEEPKPVVEAIIEPQAEPEHIETVKPETAPGPKIIGKIDLPDKAQINVEVDGVVYDQETLEAKKKESLKEERERKLAEKEAAQKAAAEAKEQARIKREEEQARKVKEEAERIERKLKEKAKQDAIRLKKEEEERKALEKARKEKQKEHYNQKFKPKAAPKKTKKRTATEPVATESKKTTQTEEVKETSLYKRFINWLNR
jgi:translation initiation factor 4G